MKKRILPLFLLFLIVTVMVVGLSGRLTLTEYSISNSRIPASFDGYRIALVSDLHAVRFGENQKDLITMLQESQCDLICFGGDMVSRDTTDFSPLWELTDGLAGIPMVYVAGNNELSIDHYEDFLSELANHGVTVLDDIAQTTLELEQGTDRKSS